jgi:uncharacterized RDD family membrane protein YckC
MSSFEPATAWDTSDETAGAEPTYAGFWIRAVAVILDGLILGIPLTAVLLAIDEYGTSTGALLQTAAGAAYSIVLWVTWGRTVGGRVVGLRLIRVDGRPVTYGTAIVRYLMLIVSYVALCIGVIWVAFNGKKQGWMDIAAGTYVIEDKQR